MLRDLADRQGARRQHDEPQPADEAEILQELPEMLETLARLETPECRKAPELMEQHRGNDAEAGEDEGGKAVMPAGDDADRGHDFNDDGEYQHLRLERQPARLLHGR